MKYQSNPLMVGLQEFLNFQATAHFLLTEDILPNETKECVKRMLNTQDTSPANKLAREYLSSVATAVDSFLIYKRVLSIINTVLSDNKSSVIKKQYINLILDNYHVVCNQESIHNYITYYQEQSGDKKISRVTHPLLFLLKQLTSFASLKHPVKTDKELFERHFEEFMKSINNGELPPPLPRNEPSSNTVRFGSKEQPVEQQPVEQPVKQQPVEQPVKQQPVKQQPFEQPVKQQPFEQPVEQQPVEFDIDDDSFSITSEVHHKPLDETMDFECSSSEEELDEEALENMSIDDLRKLKQSIKQ